MRLKITLLGSTFAAFKYTSCGHSRTFADAMLHIMYQQLLQKLDPQEDFHTYTAMKRIRNL